MKLYKTTKGNILFFDHRAYVINEPWDILINQENLHAHLTNLSGISGNISEDTFQEIISQHLLPPIGSQEVWAAGVTYLRSRDARMEEAKQGGGADFYQRVYEAERPELFFKASSHRVVGHGQPVHIRQDSSWNVPEPELTLYINSTGTVQAYTIGNDMSSRSIEGENPLYLPQAKVYDRSTSLGPCLFVPGAPILLDTKISLSIKRAGEEIFSGNIQINRMKRQLSELADWLYRESTYPGGCFLMTGTGIVPPDHFTLHREDEVTIAIEGIGSLTNIVHTKK